MSQAQITAADLPTEAGSISVFDSPEGMLKVSVDCFGYYIMADDFDSDCGSGAACIAKLQSWNAKHIGWESEK